MPWELTVVRYAGSPPASIRDNVPNEILGTREEVSRQIASFLSGAEFATLPSLNEKLRMLGSSFQPFPGETPEQAAWRDLTLKQAYSLIA